MKHNRMQTDFNKGLALPQLNARCVVCDIKLSPHVLQGATAENHVCKSFDCQKIWQSKNTTTPHLFSKKVEFHRQLLKQREQTEIELKLRIEKQLEQEQQERRAIEKSVIKQHERYALNSKSFPVLNLPIGPSDVTNLSKKRVTLYTQHLYQVISQAFSHSTISAAVPDTFSRHDKMMNRIKKHPDIEKLNDQFCFTCKGGCCVKGNEQAYLSADSIRRIKQQQPSLRPQALLNIYLSSLTTKVMKGSCINHTAKGCGLKREYRSEICNRFYCDDLHDYSEQYETSTEPSAGALVINRKQNLWQRNEPGDNSVQSVSIVDPNEIEIITVE